MGLRLISGHLSGIRSLSKHTTGPLHQCQRPQVPFVTAAGHATASYASPQLPLAERQAAAAVLVKDVMEWYTLQKQAVQQTGDTLAGTDGPSAADLQVYGLLALLMHRPMPEVTQWKMPCCRWSLNGSWMMQWQGMMVPQPCLEESPNGRT